MKASLRTLWDRLSLYLPVVLMGLFAMSTWWLVRSTPKLDETGSPRPVRHEIDYTLRQFSIKTFDTEGHFKSELIGAEAKHYPDTDTLEITQVKVHAISLTGEHTHATSLQAVTSANGTEVQLQGQVHVVRDAKSSATTRAPMEYRSEFLKINSQTNLLETPQPVVINQGGNRFSGNAMTYRDEGGLLELHGQVHATLMPHTAP